MKPLSLLFFYLVGEEHYDEQSEQVLGYIRIVDLKQTKTIDKIEVSCLRETFDRLRICLQKVAKSVEDYCYPESEQCFAIEWTPEIVERLECREDVACLICKEIENHVSNYQRFLRESGRFAAVS